MKVLIVLPTMAIGGVSRVAQSLARGFSDLGQEVELITLYDIEFQENQLEDSFGYTSLGVPPKRTIFSKLLVAVLRFSRLASAIRRLKPDRVYCLDPYSATACFFIKPIMKRFEVIAACYTPHQLLTRFDIAAIKSVFGKLSGLIVPSHDMQRELLTLNSQLLIEVVPNPISDYALSCNLKTTSLLARKRPRVIFLGRLSAEKQVSQIIYIAEVLAEYDFEIVGDGPSRMNLKTLMRRLNVRNVSFRGWQTPSECLPRANAVVLPSIVESFGLVIIESWLHGIPVVAYRGASGPRELINKYGGGVLVDNYKDTHEWAKKITQAADLRLATSFIQNTFCQFNRTMIAERYLAVSNFQNRPDKL